MKKTVIAVIVLFIFSAVLFGQGGKQAARADAVKEEAKEPVETGLAPVSEGKVVKREQQAPGVVTEYMEDGTKVVTINLSEIDEDSLPEKYVAEVILEAPIYRYDYIIENKDNLKDVVYFAKKIDIVMPQSLDVKIDGKGDMYIFDPYMDRVQKFDNKGRHIRDIPVKNKREIKRLPGEYYEAESMTDEISVGKGIILSLIHI